MCLRVERALADRSVERQACQSLRYLVRIGAAGLFDPLGDRRDRLIADDRPAGAVFAFHRLLQLLHIFLVLRRFALAPDHRVIGVGDDAERIIGAEGFSQIDRADLAAVDQPVLDHLEITERRRLLRKRDEIAAEHVAEHRVGFFAHLCRDEGGEIRFAQLRPFLVDDLDVGAQFLDVLDKGADRIAAIGVVWRNRRHLFDILPFRHQGGASASLDQRVGSHSKDVRVQVLRRGQQHRLRGRGDKDDLVLFGDRRDRRCFRRGKRARKEFDIVFDNHLTGEAHRLVGIRFAVTREQFELAAEHAAFGVDIGYRHLCALGDRHAVNCGRAGQRHREADLDRFLG